MKREIRNALTVAGVTLALAWPATVLSQASAQPQGAQDQMQNQDQNQNQNQQGKQDARQMVRATVTLNRDLDAKNDHNGSQFATKLTTNVQLKDGPELPKGTMLMGNIETDDMQVAGRSKLAVRFTEAKLKDGQTVPIRATIVQVYPPTGFTQDGSRIPEESGPEFDGDDHANTWSKRELKVDQIGAMRNVDMHSNVASQNSGVFVSTKTDDVKLMQGSRLELALAGQNTPQQSASR